MRARRLKKRFRVLYAFAGKQTIFFLTGFIKKSKAIPPREIKKARALKKDYLERKKGYKNG